MTPAIIMGADLKPQTISTAVDATALAPTVAGILRIRAPSGAKSKAIF
jgi:hypothetical protein